MMGLLGCVLAGEPEYRPRPGRRRAPLHQQHQRRSRVRLRQGGRILRVTPIEFDDRTRPPGPSTRAAAASRRRATSLRRTRSRRDPRCIRRPATVSDEARRLRPGRRTQSAEPRHLRLRARHLGRGAGPRVRRDHARAPRARARRGVHRARLAPHLGHARLLPQRPPPLLQRHRAHPHDAQPGQLGGLVLGRRPPLGPQHARRRRRVRGHGRGPAQGVRAGRVLVHDPEATTGIYAGIEGTVRRQWSRTWASRACTSTPSTTTPRTGSAASGSRRGRPRASRWRTPSPTSG